MSNQQHHQLVQEWLKIARNDLGYAKLGLREDNYYAQTAFLAQQAAEKSLKGFLALHQTEFRKTHDLVELLNQCADIDNSFGKLREHADLLTPFSVEARYPIGYPAVQKEHAKEAVMAASKVVRFVEEKARS